MVAQAMRIWILHDLLTSEVWTLFRVCAVNTKNEDTMQSSWSITHSNNGITSVTNVNQQFRVISLINLIIVIVIYDAINMTMLSKWFAVKRIRVFFLSLFTCSTCRRLNSGVYECVHCIRGSSETNKIYVAFDCEFVATGDCENGNATTRHSCTTIDNRWKYHMFPSKWLESKPIFSLFAFGDNRMSKHMHKIPKIKRKKHSASAWPRTQTHDSNANIETVRFLRSSLSPYKWTLMHPAMWPDNNPKFVDEFNYYRDDNWTELSLSCLKHARCTRYMWIETSSTKRSSAIEKLSRKCFRSIASAMELTILFIVYRVSAVNWGFCAIGATTGLQIATLVRCVFVQFNSYRCGQHRTTNVNYLSE